DQRGAQPLGFVDTGERLFQCGLVRTEQHDPADDQYSGHYQRECVRADRANQKRRQQHTPGTDRDLCGDRDLAAALDRIRKPLDIALEPGDLLAQIACHGSTTPGSTSPRTPETPW